MKALVEQALWKYTSVFLAQPFEVAKTVLQVQLAGQEQKSGSKFVSEDNVRRRPGNYRRHSYEVWMWAARSKSLVLNAHAERFS